MSYSNCCECPRCSARSEGVKSGELFYDRHSQLRLKANPEMVNAQAVAVYMRERDRKQRALRLAAGPHPPPEEALMIRTLTAADLLRGAPTTPTAARKLGHPV